MFIYIKKKNFFFKNPSREELISVLNSNEIDSMISLILALLKKKNLHSLWLFKLG